VSPLGHNLKIQYSIEEQIMQLQLSSNIESHLQFTYTLVSI
jgi:hypothetical protein